MIILNISHISNSVQIITDTSYTRTCPMEERCGELYFKAHGIELMIIKQYTL